VSLCRFQSIAKGGGNGETKGDIKIGTQFCSLALRIGSGWRGDIEQADKDIHEHQLGWRWRAPSDQIFIEFGSDILLKAEEEKVEVAPEVVDDLAITMRKEIYSTLLATLCSEAFFLVDEKTREKLPSLSPSLQDWVQCQSILQALGVQNGASLEKLRISLAGVFDSTFS
jgi:hypothetical protein